MTPETMAMAQEAVFVTLAKGLLAFCLCAMALIVAREFWEFGRGAESIWPEADEPQQADVPRSFNLRDVDASGGRGLQLRNVGAATPIRKENAAPAIDIPDF